MGFTDESIFIEQVHAAASWVSLSFNDGEASVIASLLNQWIPAAIELNAKMQSPQYDTIVPITVYRLPADTLAESPLEAYE